MDWGDILKARTIKVEKKKCEPENDVRGLNMDATRRGAKSCVGPSQSTSIPSVSEVSSEDSEVHDGGMDTLLRREAVIPSTRSQLFMLCNPGRPLSKENEDLLEAFALLDSTITILERRNKVFVFNENIGTVERISGQKISVCDILRLEKLFPSFYELIFHFLGEDAGTKHTCVLSPHITLTIKLGSAQGKTRRLELRKKMSELNGAKFSALEYDGLCKRLNIGPCRLCDRRGVAEVTQGPPSSKIAGRLTAKQRLTNLLKMQQTWAKDDEDKKAYVDEVVRVARKVYVFLTICAQKRENGTTRLDKLISHVGAGKKEMVELVCKIEPIFTTRAIGSTAYVRADVQYKMDHLEKFVRMHLKSASAEKNQP